MQDLNATPGAPGPLAGFRVLDLSQFLAGPYCSMMLADMGAEVIKVEPREGDGTRQFGPPYIQDQSAYFLSVNRNKKCIILNLTTDRGRKIFLDLAERADVVLENFRPGVVTELGLDYKTVYQRNPRITYCSISAFGQEGPYRDRPGIDLIFQALGGVLAVTGEEGGPPSKVGFPVADVTAGLFAANGILLALLARERTGVGQKVEIAALDTLLAVQATNLSYYFATGQTPGRLGSASPFLVPAQYFQTRDQVINVSIPTDRFFRRLCVALELGHLQDDPRFSSVSQRLVHRHELIPLLQAKFRKNTCQEWLTILAGQGIPCAPCYDYGDLIRDPQIVHNDMLAEIEHPTAGQIKVTGIPIRLSQTPGQLRSPPPLLGEHTEEILADLGYKAAEIEGLRNAAVI